MKVNDLERSRKATAIGPSNIAFTKYWGKKDEVLRLPLHGSISMTLSNLLTTTTVEFSDKYKNDQVIINGGGLEKDAAERVIKHLDRIRQMARIEHKAKVVSNNNFPSGTGLASSASGFAALTLAASAAAGLTTLSEKQLSILARQGSGSACRSIPSGFVEWLDGNTSETSYAVQIFPENWWKIADVVVILSSGKKDVSSSKGQGAAFTSPFLPIRLSNMKKKNQFIKKLIKNRDFKKFGEVLEAEALEFHSITLTQTPPLIYWLPTTVMLMKLVQKWRNEGLDVYFTVDTGQDIHLFCEQKDVEKVKAKLKKIKEVKNIIVNHPGQGARLIQDHLF